MSIGNKTRQLTAIIGRKGDGYVSMCPDLGLVLVTGQRVGHGTAFEAHSRVRCERGLPDPRQRDTLIA